MFADAPGIRETVTRFNALVEALAYVSAGSALQKARKDVTAQVAAQSDKNAKSQAREKLKNLTPKALAEMAGSRQDDEFLKQLAFLLDYGFRDQLQLQIPFEAGESQLLFSAALHRESLRESEQLLLHKYSRLTDRPLVVVGVPTQSGGAKAPAFDGGEGTVRGAMGELYTHLSGIEGTFAGRMEREVVLDPIAIYVQWEVSLNGSSA